MYYPIKIFDTTFSTYLHPIGPANLTFTETFVNTNVPLSNLADICVNFSVNLTGPLINDCFVNKVPGLLLFLYFHVNIHSTKKSNCPILVPHFCIFM